MEVAVIQPRNEPTQHIRRTFELLHKLAAGNDPLPVFSQTVRDMADQFCMTREPRGQRASIYLSYSNETACVSRISNHQRSHPHAPLLILYKTWSVAT